MRGPITCLAALLTWAAVASPCLAQLTSTETSDVTVVYVQPTQSYIVPHVGRSFENALAFHEKMFDFKPGQKVTLLLTDFSDAGNASADAVPRDFVTLRIAPMNFAFETFTASERMSYLLNHELVHVFTLDRPAPRDALFRDLFRGKVAPVAEHPESIGYLYLTTPRRASPRWYLEGIAVFLDTWMAGGLGRAQGPYDEMVFRSMVLDGTHFPDPLALAAELTKTDFQVEANSYLYGTRFMNYLAYTYTPEALIRWVTRSSGSKAYYASSFRQVYGMPIEQAWQDWIRFEQAFQRQNIAKIREYPTTPYHDVAREALGSLSRAYVDPERRTIYAGVNYPGTLAYVGGIGLDDGRVERLHDIKLPRIYTVTSLAYDGNHTLFYTADNTAERDLVALDTTTRQQHTLLKDARIGELAFNRSDRSIWGIRTFNGICTLVRIPYPYTQWNALYSWPYGEVAYDLDVSPDGRLVSASVGEISGQQSVRVMNAASLLMNDATPLKQFDFGTAIPSNFIFTPDNRYLIGSSYYTGVSNIFRYEIATGELEALTNAETGFFRPVPLDDGSLLVFRYTGNGFVPSIISARPITDVSAITFFGQQLAEKHPIVKQWAAGSPGAVPIESMIVGSPRRYRPLRRLGLESVYPVVQGYKDSVAYGGYARFSDPLSLNGASITAAFSPDRSLPGSERVHLRADYRRFEWTGHAAWNNADFYDLFGPTKTSRRGYDFGAGHTNLLLFDEPRRMTLTIDGRVAGHLDQLPEYQNVPVRVDRLYSVKANLAFTNVRSSLGSVDEEKGFRWSVAARNDVVKSSSFSRVQAAYDQGVALPLPHSSVWFRTAAGFSPQDAAEPFANFYFGGFGNNYVDHQDEKRYREYYALPGAGINEIGGRNFGKATVEWNIPPLRFRRAGTPGFYLTWMRPAVFATGLVTNVDAAGLRRKVADAGGQLDFRLSMLSTLDLTLSVGGAVTYEPGFAPRREAMISLKILR